MTTHEQKVIRLRKFPPIIQVLIGIGLIIGAVYALTQGLDAKNKVTDTMRSQEVTTPADASIPNELVDDPATAESMAQIIDKHARESAGGLTYSKMGRFATPDGNPAGTNEAAQAAKDANGKPMANAARNSSLNAAALQTAMYASVMGMRLSDLVIGLSALLAVLGIFFITQGVINFNLADKIPVRQ